MDKQQWNQSIVLMDAWDQENEIKLNPQLIMLIYVSTEEGGGFRGVCKHSPGVWWFWFRGQTWWGCDLGQDQSRCWTREGISENLRGWRRCGNNNVAFPDPSPVLTDLLLRIASPTVCVWQQLHSHVQKYIWGLD